MIVDTAKAARKDADDGEAFPTVQPAILPAPPAYEPSSPSTSAAVSSPVAQIPSPHTPLIPPSADAARAPEPESAPTKKDGPALRFLKAFLVALLVYALLASLFASIINIAGWHRRLPKGEYPWGKPVPPIADDGSIIPGYGCLPKSFDGDVLVSTSHRKAFPGPGRWAEARESFTNMLSVFRHDRRYREPYVARARFTLPSMSVRSFHMISRGAHSKGNILYKPGDVDSVTIDIVISYFDPAARATANLCLLEKNSTHQGFGIFTPRKEWDWVPYHERFVQYDIIVRLPSDSFYHVVDMQTDLANFNQSLAHFAYPWNSISIKGTNGKVLAERSDVHDFNITTTNGSVGGSFFVDSSLTLATTNGDIGAIVELYNEKPKLPTNVSFRTFNGAIESSIALTTVRREVSSYPGYGGAFDISAQTTNGPVTLDLHTIPIQSSVQLTTRNSNAPAKIYVNRAYEGSFALWTSPGYKLTIDSDLKSTDDPQHRGREPRLVVSTIDNGFVDGTFKWERARSDRGGGRPPSRWPLIDSTRPSRLEIANANSDVRLVFD